MLFGEVCGVHVGTVLKWSRRAAEGGADAVIKGGQRGRRDGSGRKLTPIQDAGRKVFLIVDNLRVHHAHRVKDWLAERRKELEVFFLPAYSPELNPDEDLNRDLKTNISCGPIARTAVALTEKARAAMAKIAAMPERVKSYFHHAPVSYAM